ncbi:LodA/GoxA family CTQ-dependent oxidase [Trinickia sp. LjRoot230]|uniref:LodA/GoxA family CTQ-dependent oxidase n=1 Tax=Trinickia sp. LjRoot230 TaxID=3342288 RepID=UPI003ECEEA9B
MIEYKIHPSIGIARVGNAPEQFYIGPEVYRGLPINPDGRPFQQQDLRDEASRLCRQAARFRVYRIDGDTVEEVTLSAPSVKSIRWTVHLANKKPSWYEFVPLQGQDGFAPNHRLRNAGVSNRHELLIDAGPRRIAGRNQRGVHFNREQVPAGYRGAHFPPGPLYPTMGSIDTLGELQTDADGRLLVLGGYGISGTTDPDPELADYANNDGWWDDTSDGPVGATIEFSDGTVIDAASARVLVAPPKYAPEIPNLVTLYDLMFDVMVRAGRYPDIYKSSMWQSGRDGYRPNFQTDIQPFLERATLYPWVTAMPPKPHTFDIAKLRAIGAGGDGADEFKGLRRYLVDVLRPPGAENSLYNAAGASMMPFLGGDDSAADTATAKYMRVTDTQYFFLQQWAEGYFVDRYPDANAADAFTRAALDNCVGAPLCPGIEMTWIARVPEIYAEPFRIRNRFVETGPLRLGYEPASGMEPGDLTRYMAIPWQSDFNECSSYPIDDRLIWWWPAHRPAFVYLEPQRETVIASPSVPPSPQPGSQVPWIGTDFDQLAKDYIGFADDVDMVRYWSELGFVIEKSIDGAPRFVEVERTLPRPFLPPPPTR